MGVASPRDEKAVPSKHTPGPWHYIASTEHHGPYVMADYGGDVCDCYTMSNLAAASVRNGGTSFPVPFQGENADANARLIAAAPDLLAASVAALAEFRKLQATFAGLTGQYGFTTDDSAVIANLAAAIAKATREPDTRGEARRPSLSKGERS